LIREIITNEIVKLSKMPSMLNFKQLPLRDLILEQARINDNIIKRLATNDKILEDINAKLDDFSSGIKDQLNHNNQIETRLAQLAVALPFATNPGQVQSITTRGGRSTCDPLYPKGTMRRQAALVIPTITEEKDDEVEELEPPVPEMTQDFHDSNILPFPHRKRKAKANE
jgi:hypothetical protein